MNRTPHLARRADGRAGAPHRDRARTLAGRLAVLAATALVCWTVLAFTVQYLRTYTLAREAARLERHRRELLVQNASLLAEIRRLRTDDQYIERLAREQLGMLRPGEIELVIVPASPAKRHIEREPAGPQAAAPPAGRLESARALLQRMAERVRETAEQTLERWHRTFVR